MAFCKSFACLSGTFYIRHAFEAKTRNGVIFNYRKILNGKRFFNTEATLKARFRSKRNPNNQEYPVFQKLLECQQPGSQCVSVNILWKPLIFTLAFSAGSFVGCAIWQYENMRKHAISIRKGFSSWYPDKILQRGEKKSSWKSEVKKIWNDLSEAEKLFLPIFMTNFLVFLAWKVPRLQRTMLTYFSSHPTSDAVCWPLILCAFSHCSAIHLGLNMYALNSFSKIGVASLGKEQFLCLYLIGGVISSFTSLFYKVVKNKRGLSVGASGAIMTVVAYICTKYPGMELSIIGFPWLTFTGGSAIKVLMTFDLLGLVLGWRFLDHAAHLGGAFFGILWCYWGDSYIWHKKDMPLQWWHKFRNSVQ